MNPSTLNLWPAWRAAARRAVIDAAIRDLYARLDADIAARGPTCWQSGKCCKFGSYGHRLYVTGLEIAWFLGHLRSAVGDRRSGKSSQTVAAMALPQIADRTSQTADSPDACPYQIDGLCSTHAIRPLGCRIFFCQQGTQDWQQDLYEGYLKQLRTLHDAHGLEYRYMEWRDGLRAGQAALAGGG